MSASAHPWHPRDEVVAWRLVRCRGLRSIEDWLGSAHPWHPRDQVVAAASRPVQLYIYLFFEKDNVNIGANDVRIIRKTKRSKMIDTRDYACHDHAVSRRSRR